MYAQYVTSTMEALNIPDVSKDRRFPWAVSSRCGPGARAAFPRPCSQGPSAGGPAWNGLCGSDAAFPDQML